jgi:glycosyl transferase, family 25
MGFEYDQGDKAAMSNTPSAVNAWVNAVYVLSVKTSTERIAHVTQQMESQGIRFEFVFDHDADDIDETSITEIFTGSDLTLKQKSLILKNIKVWREAASKGYQRILVFEDDVILDKDFVSRFNEAMQAAQKLAEGWLIFLGGKDVKVPNRYFLAKGPLIELPITTAEALVCDITAIIRRLAWLENHKIALPADHLMCQIDSASETPHYWLTHPIVEQGSTTGMFISQLDAYRQKHSLLFTKYRNQWKKIRRNLRGSAIKTLAKLRLLKP